MFIQAQLILAIENRVACYVLRVARYELRVAGYELRAAGHKVLSAERDVRGFSCIGGSDINKIDSILMKHVTRNA